MTNYPTDLQLDSDRDIQLNDANDLATVSGRGNLEQSVGISSGEAVGEFVGSRLSGTNIALFEERIRRALNENPKVSTVDSVSVVEYDTRTNEVRIDVNVSENEDFEMTVSP